MIPGKDVKPRIRIFPIHYKKLNFRTLFTLRAIASIDADATFKLVFVTISVIVGGGDCEENVNDADAKDENKEHDIGSINDDDDNNNNNNNKNNHHH